MGELMYYKAGDITFTTNAPVFNRAKDGELSRVQYHEIYRAPLTMSYGAFGVPDVHCGAPVKLLPQLAQRSEPRSDFVLRSVGRGACCRRRKTSDAAIYVDPQPSSKGNG